MQANKTPGATSGPGLLTTPEGRFAAQDRSCVTTGMGRLAHVTTSVDTEAVMYQGLYTQDQAADMAWPTAGDRAPEPLPADYHLRDIEAAGHWDQKESAHLLDAQGFVTNTALLKVNEARKQPFQDGKTLEEMQEAIEQFEARFDGPDLFKGESFQALHGTILDPADFPAGFISSKIENW